VEVAPVPVRMAIVTLLTRLRWHRSGAPEQMGRATQARRVAVWLGAALTSAVVLPQFTEPDGGRLRLSIFMAGSVALAYGAVVVLVLAALWWARIVELRLGWAADLS
jgi:cobalamin synthase